MSKIQAIQTVAKYIVENELYNFKSLSDEAQKRLKTAFGSTFEIEVNKQLNLM